LGRALATARALRAFLPATFFPPGAQVIHSSGYSTRLGREVKGKHREAIYREIMRRQKVLTALAQKAVLPVAGANVLRWLRKQRGLGIVDGDDSPEILALANTEREAKAVIWST
jgi:hypothetical protein